MVSCYSDDVFQEGTQSHSPNGPNVARLRPAELENHLGRPVMPRRHNGAVVLVVEGGTAEVNKPYVRRLDATHFAIL